MHIEFPGEDIMALFEEEGEDEDKEKWIVWFDGVSNVLGHGIGAVLVSSNKQRFPFTARLCFIIQIIWQSEKWHAACLLRAPI